MQRILVMGSSGSGKSTFARRLSATTGCPEKIDFEFFRYVWICRKEQRPKLQAFFEGLRPDQTFITFTDRVQVDRYLSDLVPVPPPASVH